MVGYCFGRPGHNAAQLGPLLARDIEAASALVRACLAGRRQTRWFLDAPEATPWRGELQRLGFALSRPFTRMYRGQGLGERDDVFAIVGPEFA